MKTVFKQYSQLIWVCFIFIIGLASMITFNDLFSQNSIQSHPSDNPLSLTGDYINSEVQKELLKPIFISTLMAQEPFVQNWILNDEQDKESITTYLKEIKEKNKVVTSFLISNSTYQQYQSNGQLKTIHENDVGEKWFLQTRSSIKADETHVNIDLKNHHNITAFAHHRVVDTKNNFIGVVGVSFTMSAIKKLIDAYQNQFQRQIYFTDNKGNVVLSSNQNLISNLAEEEGIQKIATQILKHKSIPSLQLEYQTQNKRISINSRYIPELDWYLLVAQDSAPERPVAKQLLFINLAIFSLIAMTVILIIFFMLRRHQVRLEKFASTDKLTRLINRPAFDFIFQQAILDSDRTREPLCVALMDVDHFKQINHKNSPLVGDHVLREIAMIAKRSLRESDVICRWGGEEFLILLKNCSLEKAASIAETLRSTIEANDFSRTTDLSKKRLRSTVSIGVAQCQHKELEDGVFERAVTALLQAKESGRNCVYFSE